MGLIAKEFGQSPSRAYLFPRADPHMTLAIDNLLFDLIKEFEAEVEKKRQEYIEQQKLAANMRRGAKQY